jgi:hypothetical protein
MGWRSLDQAHQRTMRRCAHSVREVFAADDNHRSIPGRHGHSFQQLHGPLNDPNRVIEHGEVLGLVSRAYEMVDVMPVESIARSSFKSASLS